MTEYRIDCAEISSRAQLHDVLAETLRLPQWYGRNLDALYDCLTELAEETQLHLLHFDALNAISADYADALLQVLDDAGTDNPSFLFTVEK